MNFQKSSVQKLILLTGGILTLLIPPVSPVHAETEDVEIIGRKPDETDPLFEIIEVEGGLFFRAPKDMTFVKKDGVIGPISTEEYCLKKIEAVKGQIEVLNKRVSALEKNAGTASDKQSLRSL